MTRYITFLRAINVGGGRTIKMHALRQLFESLGFSGAETFIASGNVVFETTRQSAKTLEKKIEKGLSEALGYEVAAFIRTEAKLAKIANYKPFRQSQIDAAAELNIIFLAKPLNERLQEKIRALRTDLNAFRVHGQEIYWLRRKKPSGSPFSTVPLEKTLAQPFTIRGAKTVKKMATKYSPAKS